MKFKFNSKFWAIFVGITLATIELVSIFAQPIQQSLYTKPSTDLPKSNIIDYQLDSSLANEFVQQGATIVTFNYNLGCDNCIVLKSTLESYAKQYKQQVFLEELLNNNLNQSQVTVTSIYGEERLVNANDTGIFSSLCKLMVAPPADCVLIK